MAIIKSVRGFTPVIGENTFLADNATVIGDATIGRDCSIWFSAVVRGDVNKITIGDRFNDCHNYSVFSFALFLASHHQFSISASESSRSDNPCFSTCSSI